MGGFGMSTEEQRAIKLRENVCPDIADNGPAPNKSIVKSMYHFDLSHNLLQKTRLFGIMLLKSSLAGVAVIPAKDKTAIVPGPA